jgi:PAS domain S-box-containing protein
MPIRPAMSELDTFTAVLEVVPDAVFIVAEDGRVVAVNNQAEALTGYGRSDLVGRPVEMLVPRRSAGPHPGYRGGYFAAARRRPMGTGLDTRVLRRDGREIPVDIALSPLAADGQRYAVASVRDITEQRRNRDQVEAALAVAQATLEGSSAEHVLDVVEQRARQLTGGDIRVVVEPDGAVELVRQDGPEAAPDPALQFLATQASLGLEHTRIQEELQRLALVDERERIGRELHDGAIQAIFAIGMSLEGLAARTAEPEVAARLRGVVAQLDAVIRDLRNYIYGLRPGIVAQQHLQQALRQLVEDFASSSGVTAIADLDPDVAQALTARAGDVILLAGEALSNVGRHAHALTCRLTLRREGDAAVLEVEDDGRGFDPSAPRRGQGLRNLRDRAARLGGSAELESRKGEGTTVRFTMPLGPV